MYYRPKVIAATAPPPRRQRAVCRSAGVFDFALFPWWRFAICRRHVCCTAYLQPLALRRRLDVPSTGRVSPLALSSRQSPVVTVPNIASFSLASRQKGEFYDSNLCCISFCKIDKTFSVHTRQTNTNRCHSKLEFVLGSETSPQQTPSVDTTAMETKDKGRQTMAFVNVSIKHI
ncbi:hypothetical protein ACI65C_001919 [Semiaphis heraclei]